MKNKKILLILFIFINIYVLKSEDIEVWQYWEGATESKFLLLAENYKKTTGVNLKIKKVPWGAINTRYKVLTEKGTGPDLIIGPADWIGQFIVDGLIQPIDEMITKDKKNVFIEKLYENGIHEGKIYGLPISYSMITFICNKNLVEKTPRTTKEMIEIGQKLTDEENGKFGLVYKIDDYYYHWAWVTGFGGSPLDKDKNATFSSKAQIDALKFVKSIHSGENKIMPSEETGGDIMINLFFEGSAAMMLANSWELKEISNSGIEFEVIRMPIVSETGLWPKPLVSTKVIMMSSNTKNKKIAYDVIDYLTSEDVQYELSKTENVLPTVKSVYEYKKFKESPIYKYMKKVREQADYSVPMPTDPELSIGVWPYGGGMIREVLIDEKDIEVAAKEAQEKAEIALKEYRENIK